MHEGDALLLAQRADQAPVQKGQAMVFGEEQVAGVGVRVKQGGAVLREDRPGDQRFDDEVGQAALLVHGNQTVLGDLSPRHPFHGRDAGSAMIEQRGDLDPRLALVEGPRPHEVTLLQVEPDFLAELLPDLFKHFPVIDVRDPELLAPFIQVRSHPLQQLQFLFETLLDAGLEDLEHPVVGRCGASRRKGMTTATLASARAAGASVTPSRSSGPSSRARMSWMVSTGTAGGSDSSP